MAEMWQKHGRIAADAATWRHCLAKFTWRENDEIRMMTSPMAAVEEPRRHTSSREKIGHRSSADEAQIERGLRRLVRAM